MTEAGALRLDLWLVRHREMSRSAAQAAIGAGLVTVNGRPARSSSRVDVDAVVEVVAAPEVEVIPEVVRDEPEVELVVVFEDELLAVIDKPAGLVVHPAPGHPHGTVADGLRQRGDTWSHVGGPERAGIVHRLDRDTSGLMVVAKTEQAHRSLSKQLMDRTLGRTYWAAVWGGFNERTATIDAPIGRDPRDRKRMAVVDRGRSAVTDFTVGGRLGPATELDVDLRTGRTHQIRVHLAHIGRPLVGDPVYGRRKDPFLGRPALHARRLRFTHPRGGQICIFESPMPDDLIALRARLAAMPS